jgi:hypothetical protein
MYTTETATVMLITPGPSMAAKAIASMSPGKEYTESMTRDRTLSSQLPANPEMRPRGMPMMAESMEAAMATPRMVRAP